MIGTLGRRKGAAPRARLCCTRGVMIMRPSYQRHAFAAEAAEATRHNPVEGVRTAGGNWVATMRFAVLPQSLPLMLAHVLYIFESNVRSSTILGIVGAGGIGFQLSDRIRALRWDEAAFIILMILLLVAVIDALSGALRRRLTSGRR